MASEPDAGGINATGQRVGIVVVGGQHGIDGVGDVAGPVVGIGGRINAAAGETVDCGIAGVVGGGNHKALGGQKLGEERGHPAEPAAAMGVHHQRERTLGSWSVGKRHLGGVAQTGDERVFGIGNTGSVSGVDGVPHVHRERTTLITGIGQRQRAQAHGVGARSCSINEQTGC